jgi:hypothetical protein
MNSVLVLVNDNADVVIFIFCRDTKQLCVDLNQQSQTTLVLELLSLSEEPLLLCLCAIITMVRSAPIKSSSENKLLVLIVGLFGVVSCVVLTMISLTT